MSEVVATAGAVRIVITGEGANFSAAVAETNKQLDRLGQGAKSAGGAVKKEMGEARGTIMVLGEEIGVHLPRHVQKFVAGLPGVASAMSAAFSGVAVIAIGAAILEAGKKVYEFAEKSADAARKSEEAWRAVDAPLRMTADEMRLANDKLDAQIAKLEHKPHNAMKEAIDEAIVSAERLGQQLDADLQKLTEKLDGSSWYSKLYEFAQGNAGSGDITDRSKNLQDQLNKIELDGRNRLVGMRSQGATDTQLGDATRDIQAARQKALDGEVDWINRQLDEATKKQANVGGKNLLGRTDQTQRIGVLTHYGADVSSMADMVDQSQLNADKTKRFDQDTAKDEAERAAKEAAAKQMGVWRQELEAEKALHGMNLDAEASFWQRKADAAKHGSVLYNAALMEANKNRAQSQAQAIKDYVSSSIEDAQREKQLGNEIDEAVTSTWEAAMHRDEEAQKKMQASAIEAFKLADQQQKAAQAIEEERIKLQVQMGQISKLAGAQQLQTLHEQGFKDFSDASDSFRKQFKDVPTPGAPETLRQYGVQSQKDQAEVEASTALGQLGESARRLIASFTDIPAHIAEIFERTLGDLNSKIVDELSGKKNVNFGEVGVTAAKGVENLGLQFVEGKLLSGLGLGKLGTQDNPMWVRIAEATGAAVGGGIAALLSKFFGGGSTTSAAARGVSGAASVVSGIGGIFAHLPGFATGGPVPANMPIMVGENGPEPFIPTSSGRIIPSGEMGGGDTHFHIDARGASDPAATKAAIHQALSQFSRQVPSMALSAVRDHNSRVPSNMRVGR